MFSIERIYDLTELFSYLLTLITSIGVDAIALPKLAIKLELRENKNDYY